MVSLRGLLYRKLVRKEKKKVEEELPGFKLKPTRIVELPEVKDLRELHVVYPLIEPFAYAEIGWDESLKACLYKILEPELDAREKQLLEKISEALVELIEVRLVKVREPSKAIAYLREKVQQVARDFNLSLSSSTFVKLMYYLYRNFVGLNEIEPLLQDPNIEDISCDGVGIPLYVVHRKYGSLRTNVVFESLDKLRDFVIKLAERCGRYVSYAEPILAGTLPDGSRVSATLAGDVATRGPVFTVRKFGAKPFSPIDQIFLKTADASILAYLWFLIDHNASILISGGVATGKTSFLNSIAMFIQPEAKIVSIEDTRELQIPHEHWIPNLARTGFGIPLPTGEKYGGVSLFDLLKESFRQNPDYVIVGEVRGVETYVMFQGIASGHPSISTFHAGSLDSIVSRLTSPPINLSLTLVGSLDVVVLLVHAREKGKSARRIKEILEIVGVDTREKKVLTNKVFEWDPATDSYVKVKESVKIGKLAAARGMSEEEARKEVERRKAFLEWLASQQIRDYLEVTKKINEYYKEKEKVLKKIKAPPLPTAPPAAPPPLPPVAPSPPPTPTPSPPPEKPKPLPTLEGLGLLRPRTKERKELRKLVEEFGFRVAR